MYALRLSYFMLCIKYFLTVYSSRQAQRCDTSLVTSGFANRSVSALLTWNPFAWSLFVTRLTAAKSSTSNVICLIFPQSFSSIPSRTSSSQPSTSTFNKLIFSTLCSSITADNVVSLHWTFSVEESTSRKRRARHATTQWGMVLKNHDIRPLSLKPRVIAGRSRTSLSFRRSLNSGRAVLHNEKFL